MANARKPRKKKPNVNPAVKERRQAYRDKAELSQKVRELIGNCDALIVDLDSQIEPVKGSFTQEERQDYDNIYNRCREDVQTFAGQVDAIDEALDKQIEDTFKNDKIDVEGKFEIMAKVLDYNELAEKTINYMGSVEDAFMDFVEKFNGNAEKAETKEEEKA